MDSDNEVATAPCSSLAEALTISSINALSSSFASVSACSFSGDGSTIYPNRRLF
ncbi:hypothetical protein D3C74_418710 [compost metagenome]